MRVWIGLSVCDLLTCILQTCVYINMSLMNDAALTQDERIVLALSSNIFFFSPKPRLHVRILWHPAPRGLQFVMKNDPQILLQSGGNAKKCKEEWSWRKLKDKVISCYISSSVTSASTSTFSPLHFQTSARQFSSPKWWAQSKPLCLKAHLLSWQAQQPNLLQYSCGWPQIKQCFIFPALQSQWFHFSVRGTRL